MLARQGSGLGGQPTARIATAHDGHRHLLLSRERSGLPHISERMPTDAQAQASRAPPEINDFFPADSSCEAECRILLPVASAYNKPIAFPELEAGTQHFRSRRGHSDEWLCISIRNMVFQNQTKIANSRVLIRKPVYSPVGSAKI